MTSKASDATDSIHWKVGYLPLSSQATAPPDAPSEYQHCTTPPPQNLKTTNLCNPCPNPPVMPAARFDIRIRQSNDHIQQRGHRPNNTGSTDNAAFRKASHYRFVITDKLFENGTPPYKEKQDAFSSKGKLEYLSFLIFSLYLFGQNALRRQAPPFCERHAFGLFDAFSM